MTLNPIHKVLSTLFTRRVRALLMGGQACILYGASEFSRDTDIALHASNENIELLRDALRHLQARRTPFALPTGEEIYLMSLPDLVRSKKTQRDKDWPMIRRLIEADYINNENPTIERVRFWLRESRTPRILIELAREYKSESESILSARSILESVYSEDESAIEEQLEKEQKLEREIDRQYWKPLLSELEDLRRAGYDTEEEV